MADPEKPVFHKWAPSIRSGGTLLVAKGSTASGWSSAFTTGIARFNTLSDALKLGIRYKEATSETGTSAHVFVEAVEDAYSHGSGRQRQTGNLDKSGNKGATGYQATTDGIEKAFIFLPLRSKHGEFMKLCMFVHELCHATGLHEHSSLVKPDITAENLLPSGDKVEAGVFNARVMPPIWMAFETGAKIRDCWT